MTDIAKACLRSDAETRMAAPTYDELVALVAELRATVARLEADNARLCGERDAARRDGKRQAAPFRKGPPKSHPKTPGRKPGAAHGRHGHRPAPPPEQVDERHDAPLPDDCPHCHGPLIETAVVPQFQTEIPRRPLVRQFDVHVGRCPQCRVRVQGRHPLQTSDALGAAASQLGPDAQAAVVQLNKSAGLAHGKVAATFAALFGVTLSRGASAQIGQRAAQRLAPAHAEILHAVRSSERLTVDETGWHVGGRTAWLHAWVGTSATGYAIDPRRGADALERVIGLAWDGVLIRDGFSAYDRFTGAVHQLCCAHILRRARDLLATATRGAVRFPRAVLALFGAAVHLRNQYHRGEVTADALATAREDFETQLLRLVNRSSTVPAYATFAAHLGQHFESWFTCLTTPAVPATNWAAEQALRPAVVNRKVWGGNRTWRGAGAQAVLSSVLETCRRQGRSALDFVSQTLRCFGQRPVPRLIETG